MKINYNLVKRSSLEDFANKHKLELDVNERTDPALPKYYVAFKSSEVKDGSMLISSSGDGNTIDEAIDEYKKKVSNKVLVINAMKENRREIRVPKLT